MKNRLRLVGAIAVLAGVNGIWADPAFAQASIDRSQRILAGLEPFSPGMAWPASIELPAVWREAFGSMAELQRTTGREHGACLSVNPLARNTEEIESQLQAYLQLRAQREKLPAAEFARREQALRSRIESPVGTAGAGALMWQVGQPQSGSETSVALEENINTCGGSYLGRVHTHPPSTVDSFSDSDAMNAVLGPAKVSVVAMAGGEVCVAVRGVGKRESVFDNPFNFGAFTERSTTSYPEFKIAYQAQSLAFAYRQTEAAARANRREPAGASNAREQGLLATALGGIGGALYCGPSSRPLKRVDAFAPADLIDARARDQAAMVMATKGLVIMLNRLQSGPWKRQPTFPFTPVLDDEFLAYLRAVQPSQAGESDVVEALQRVAGKPAAAVQAVDLFRLVFWLSGENYPGLGDRVIFAPDDRSAPQRAGFKMQFNCAGGSPDASEFYCAVTEVAGNRVVGVAAMYRMTPSTGEGSGSHLFADHATGTYHIYGPVPVSYRGQLQQLREGVVGTARPHGQGVMEWPAFTFSGSFENGVPKGRGWMTNKATGARREVEFENGKFRAVP